MPGTTWDLLNYVGELFTADQTRAPLLSALGGLTGGAMTTDFEFPVSVETSYAAASQPDITETASRTAPTATDITDALVKNVVQIFQYAMGVTYSSSGARGRISGIATLGATPLNVVGSIDTQIARHLVQMAIDANYTFLQGDFQIATSQSVSNKSRGLIECASNASNNVGAAGATLSDSLIKQVLRTMVGNGAPFTMPVMIVNAFQNQVLSDLYGYAPTDRTFGGVALDTIKFDIAGDVGIMFDRDQPADTVTFGDLGVMSSMHKVIVGENGEVKGVVFSEPLAKTGAEDKNQLYAEIGLDHGPQWAHGTITGLAVA